MAKPIREADLVLPALYCIDREDEISTSQLSRCLRDLLQPTGEDLEILDGRNDDKFSQKVRNLKSHDTLEKLGYVTYESRGRQGYWQLTAAGRTFLEANRADLDYLFEQGFAYETTRQALTTLVATPEVSATDKPLLIDETLVIQEGKTRTKRQRVYERSSRLREIAIQHYIQDGRIICAVCEFDFEAVYGELGVGYIEIHHVKPIFTYSDEEIEQTLGEALENVVPLCANCHRMIHRKRDRMLSIDELRQIVQSRSE